MVFYPFFGVFWGEWDQKDDFSVKDAFLVDFVTQIGSKKPNFGPFRGFCSLLLILTPIIDAKSLIQGIAHRIIYMYISNSYLE